MSQEVVDATLNGQYNHGEIIIGGGEPTIHPDFWNIFDKIMCHSKTKNVSIVTNGSIKETSLELVRLARKGIVRVTLSSDKYHDPIDPDVFKAFFNKSKNRHDKRGINFGEPVIKIGRSTTGIQHHCVFLSLRFVKPSGNVYSCFCVRANYLGSVYDE